MIQGVVVNDEAQVEIAVTGPPPARQQIAAVIDTGYTGDLTLPAHVVATLQLPSAGHRRGVLADGSMVNLQVYFATVDWHGRAKDILVLETSGTALIGMRLLNGSKITMDVVDGGSVLIEELPGSP